MDVCEVSLIASHSTWHNIFFFSAAATSPGDCTGSPWHRCRRCRGPAQAPAASPRCPGCCWRHIALTLSHCQHSGHHKAGPHQAPRAQTDSPPPTPRRGRSINIVLLNKLNWHRRKNESTVSIQGGDIHIQSFFGFNLHISAAATFFHLSAIFTFKIYNIPNSFHIKSIQKTK